MQSYILIYFKHLKRKRLLAVGCLHGICSSLLQDAHTTREASKQRLVTRTAVGDCRGCPSGSETAGCPSGSETVRLLAAQVARRLLAARVAEELETVTDLRKPSPENREKQKMLQEQVCLRRLQLVKSAVSTAKIPNNLQAAPTQDRRRKKEEWEGGRGLFQHWVHLST